MGQVQDKVAFISGGGSGIGRACCKALAREGAMVAVADIDQAGGRAVAAEISTDGGRAMFLALDVADEDSWSAAVSGTVQAYGRLDVLVNNAGILVVGAVTEFSLADWRRQIAVNLDGVFLGTKHAIPAMRAGAGGSIVNISSLAGLQGSPGASGYCATKGGVRLFTKAVALECAVAGDNIRVNSVHPGIIETAIWTKINPSAGAFAWGAGDGRSNVIDPAERARQRVPSGELGTPEQVADGVVFLASDAARYITGSELVIDGGISAGAVPRRPAPIT